VVRVERALSRVDDLGESGLTARVLSTEQSNGARDNMNNIFYIIGVVVVVLVILGYFGFR
jgi:hypothetical protein